MAEAYSEPCQMFSRVLNTPLGTNAPLYISAPLYILNISSW